jgi:hypothetical protein
MGLYEEVKAAKAAAKMAKTLEEGIGERKG